MLLEAKFRKLSLYGPTIQELIYAVKYSNIAKLSENHFSITEVLPNVGSKLHLYTTTP